MALSKEYGSVYEAFPGQSGIVLYDSVMETWKLCVKPVVDYYLDKGRTKERFVKSSKNRATSATVCATYKQGIFNHGLIPNVASRPVHECIDINLNKLVFIVIRL